MSPMIGTLSSLLHVLAHQPADDHGLPVKDADAGRHLARAEDRLVDDVWRELTGCDLVIPYASNGLTPTCSLIGLP